mmetsp:Transcript_8421/g.21183  ORF Transcript_8421/g.21183 Transcript_8421/m.21183 type:complete len:166 (-) Transcript_8421:69-566(-)
MGIRAAPLRPRLRRHLLALLLAAVVAALSARRSSLDAFLPRARASPATAAAAAAATPAGEPFFLAGVRPAPPLPTATPAAPQGRTAVLAATAADGDEAPPPEKKKDAVEDVSPSKVTQQDPVLDFFLSAQAALELLIQPVIIIGSFALFIYLLGTLNLIPIAPPQ